MYGNSIFYLKHALKSRVCTLNLPAKISARPKMAQSAQTVETHVSFSIFPILVKSLCLLLRSVSVSGKLTTKILIFSRLFIFWQATEKKRPCIAAVSYILSSFSQNIES